MRLRYLAAEEKKVIATERKELEELKTELTQLVLICCFSSHYWYYYYYAASLT